MCIMWQNNVCDTYIAHAILLKCENVYDIDIADPNIAR